MGMYLGGQKVKPFIGSQKVRFKNVEASGKTSQINNESTKLEDKDSNLAN